MANGPPNRAARRAADSIKGKTKDELLARAQAAEGTAAMFKGFYEDQIRANERIVIEAEQIVGQARNEQKATERTIEIILFDELKSDVEVLKISEKTIDTFNEIDEMGEHFVHVDQTDDGFEMTLVFEPYDREEEDEQSDEQDIQSEDEDEENAPETVDTGDGDPLDGDTVDEQDDS